MNCLSSLVGSKGIGVAGKLIAVLTPHERRRGALVLLMMLALALLETIGVASIMPFLAVLGNPDVLNTNEYLAWLYRQGSFESVETFLFALGLGAFGMIVGSAAFRIVNTYTVNRYVRMREYTLSTRLLQVYVKQPYSFFLNRNSADLSKTLLSEVGQAVNYGLKPAMELLSYVFVVIVLICMLLVIDPAMASIAGLVIGGLYAVLYVGIRGLLKRMGADRISANRARFQAADEVFGGIKDLKVLGREEAYIGRFRGPAAAFSRYQHLQTTLAVVPRYVIEAVGFGGVLALALSLMTKGNGLGEVLPLLGLYAFAGYKLLPAAQQVFASLNSLRFGAPAVELLYNELVGQVFESAASEQPHPLEAVPAQSHPLELTRGIEFQGLGFTYPGAAGPALIDVNISIPARSSVGFVGSTGAGKTTAVDLILGLLSPSQGAVLIDGNDLNTVGTGRWQRIIGYVPQQIYLADASVTMNIAFGVPESQIDHAAVRRAARIARIADFIETELPQGYATEVGERGVRLSGGQRQRIGIARALYHDPQVLVFDEATSALDTATERSIMEAVDQLAGEKTIIMIAHRLSTVERCDQIILLNKGRVDGIGKYEELCHTNSNFRSFAGVLNVES